MANYYMLGGDGREYGPVSAAQLRQWSAEGRANAHTRVRPVESALWSPLGAVPELNPSAPKPTATSTTTGTRPPVPVQQLTGSGPEEPGQLVKQLGDELARGAFGMYLFGGMLLLLATLAAIGTAGLGLAVLFLPIWGGILLFLLAANARAAATFGRMQDLQAALRRLRLLFLLLGIFCVLCTIFAVALLVFKFTVGYLTGSPGGE